jgi:hypothetical protein
MWGPPSRNTSLATTPPTDLVTKPLFVYRNFVLSLNFFSIQRASYSRPELFLRDAHGRVCVHNRNGSPFWNFSSPAARSFFLDEVVAQAAMEAGSNLVFFDGWDGPYVLSNDSSTWHGSTAGSSCGTSVTFSLEYHAFLMGALSAWGRLRLLPMPASNHLCCVVCAGLGATVMGRRRRRWRRYLRNEAATMLTFLPQIAAVLNRRGKAPIFSMVNGFHVPPYTPQRGGSLLAYADVVRALASSSWMRCEATRPPAM